METPSKFLLSMEIIRVVCEYGLGWLSFVPLMHISPEGDKHPILVLPGLGTTDSSTGFLRYFLDSIGYTSFQWELGRNLGPREGIDKLISRLVDRVNFIHKETGHQQVTIIGQSLGGIYGREIAKVCPELVRQVITLGTPFKCAPHGTNVSVLYEILSKDTSHRNPEIMKKIEMAPPVPFTSIYSKTDGVVHWKSSLEIEGPISQNIENSTSSHIGMGYNPISLYILAQKLIQQKENWTHYTPE